MAEQLHHWQLVSVGLCATTPAVVSCVLPTLCMCLLTCMCCLTCAPVGTLFASTRHTVAFSPGNQGWVITEGEWPGQLMSFVLDSDGQHWRGIKVGHTNLGMSYSNLVMGYNLVTQTLPWWIWDQKSCHMRTTSA